MTRRSINVIKWTRNLPKPVRGNTDRVDRLLHTVALIMAGHANPSSGTGITIGLETIAREAWCSVAAAEEARNWLESEKWFTRTEGPKGPEWACNFDIDRGDVDPVEDRAAKRRADLAENSRRYRERKKQQKLMTRGDDASMTRPDDASRNVITLHHQRHQVASSESSPRVIKSDDGGDDNRRSEHHKSLKSLEVPKRSTGNFDAAASNDTEALFENPATDPLPKPQVTRTRRKRRYDYTPDFEAAWKLYERKGDKAEAFAAWTEAITRTDPSVILAAIPPYLAANPEKRYRKDFERWLNNDRWDSDPGEPQRRKWNPHGHPSRDQWHNASTGF
ncbi:hypothetical protein ABZ215_24805 [Amycolatopsis sp. NPDC006131]|uniref:hypothetical protein n=1 Tax=Amycolatopsis sp. NPDC006131 TaxID=3156731 RepID=UPI0033B9B9B0